MVDTIDDGKEDITVYIHDKDRDKVLIITDKNWGDAFDSWQLLWEKQQTGENHSQLASGESASQVRLAMFE